MRGDFRIRENPLMLTAEDNILLTHIEPGALIGELLRRYWNHNAIAPELSQENPTKYVRILKENLALFMDKTCQVGLLGGKCPQRSASLVYGRVENVDPSVPPWLIEGLRWQHHRDPA